MYAQRAATTGKAFRPYLYYMHGSDVFSEAKVQQAGDKQGLVTLMPIKKTTLKAIFESIHTPDRKT